MSAVSSDDVELVDPVLPEEGLVKSEESRHGSAYDDLLNVEASSRRCEDGATLVMAVGRVLHSEHHMLEAGGLEEAVVSSSVVVKG